MALAEVRNARYSDAKEVMLSYNMQSMAELLGVSYPTYQRKEDDPNNNLSVEEAKILAEHLGCPWQALFASKDV